MFGFILFEFLIVFWLFDIFANFKYCCFSFEQQKRVSLLMAAGLLEGASVGPLIDLAIDFDPR